ILALGIAAPSTRFVGRPEIVSFAGLAFSLAVVPPLVHATDRRLMCLATACQALWTNGHTLFILGPLVAWIHAACHLVRRLLTSPAGDAGARWALPLRSPAFVTALAVTGACLLNPYGLRGMLFPLRLFGELQKSSVTGRFIQELWSPFRFERWSAEMYAAM